MTSISPLCRLVKRGCREGMQAVMTLRLRTILGDCLVSFLGSVGEMGALTASIGLVRRRILVRILNRESGKGSGLGLRVRFKGSKSLLSV